MYFYDINYNMIYNINTKRRKEYERKFIVDGSNR